MYPVHWLRSRQEERELIYWLSMVAFNPRDRSLNNRIYLIYLILFFSIWGFATLTLFSSGGAIFLQMLNWQNPHEVAVLLEVLLLGVWTVHNFWESLNCSPVVFSETDEALICQTPISRRFVTIRWFVMPWLQSAIPFWLLAITLGFSLAEITLSDALRSSRLFEYVNYGLRAWLAIIPVHLTLFSMQWSIGIYRLQKDLERRRLGRLLLLVTLISFFLLVIFTVDPGIPDNSLLRIAARIAIFPLQAGFGSGNLFAALLISGSSAIVMLGIMYWVSGAFSLSRAAQETRDIEISNSALRFGFTNYNQELKTKKHLGVKRAPFRLLTPAGAAVLIWKDILQSQRAFRFPAVLNWGAIFAFMASLPFLPDFGSRALVVALWVIQVGKVSTIRLRCDLACWSLIRQLPLPHKNFLIADLSLTYLLSVILSVAGLCTGWSISRTPTFELSILIPGIVVGIIGMAGFDVIRQSQCSFLLNGSVPDISVVGVLLGFVVALVPLLIHILIAGLVGLIFSVVTCLLLGSLAFCLAIRSYRRKNFPV